MRRVLITGCAGFVGPYVADALAGGGVEVWGTDRVDAVVGIPEARYRRCDLTDGASVDSLVDASQPDGIIHLAAQSSAGHSFAEPAETVTNNILPVLHLLEHLRTNGAAVRLLAVGSADVYGPVAPEDLPLVETRAPNPMNPYALSKVMQEQICAQYAELYGVDVVMTRSFNHTGAGQRDVFVLSSFAKQIVEIGLGAREPVVEVGNVDVKRDFSDVRDIAEAYVALLKKGKRGEIYNVCSGRSRSLRDLLELAGGIAGVQFEIRIRPDLVRAVDMQELRGDHSKITAHTGWSAGIPIEKTLESLLDFWSAKRGN